MTFPTGLKRSAAMVVLRCASQFLLMKRAREPNAGRYVPVGGKLEPYEDPFSAALRETEEETGLQLDTLRYGGVLIETSPTSYNWQCNIYTANVDYFTPPVCEEGILEWIEFEEIDQLPTPPTDAYVYDYLMRGKAFAFNAVYDHDLKLVRMTEEIEDRWLIGK